jgi:ArsR family transcriptional regulator, arsenate/arsenite/antimonite-responsive transcriptional repressor
MVVELIDIGQSVIRSIRHSVNPSFGRSVIRSIRHWSIRHWSIRHREVPVARVRDIAGTAGCCPPVGAPALEQADAEALAAGFAALADPVRLRLLSMISSAGEVCSCDVVEPLGKSQPTVSHHTKVLAEAGLIRGEKRGRWTWWSVVPERLDALRDAISSGTGSAPGG